MTGPRARGAVHKNLSFNCKPPPAVSLLQRREELQVGRGGSIPQTELPSIKGTRGMAIGAEYSDIVRDP